MQRNERFECADRVVTIGFWTNAALMVMKLLAGHFGNSEAVFADGLESACDFIVILVAKFALRVGREPFDAQHPYGHGKAEHLSEILASLVIFGTGAGILINAVHTIMHQRYAVPTVVAVAAAAITILAKGLLARQATGAGKRLESPAVLAVAKDHCKDAVSSVATLVGVTGAFFGVGIMDPLAAGATAFFIFHLGYQTFRGAVHHLMDGTLPHDFVAAVTELAAAVEGVERVHEMRCRRSGQYTIIDLKLDMDPEMTVRRSHAVATEVKRRIFARYPGVGDVMIHVNPHEEEHEDMIRL